MVRLKNRYFLIQVKLNDPAKDVLKFNISDNDLAKYFKKSVQKHYGDFGSASIINFKVSYFDENSKLLIIRVSHGPHRFLSSVLPLLKLAGKELARYQTLYIGATIRQCKKFIIKYHTTYIQKRMGEITGKLQKEKFLAEMSRALRAVE